MQTIGSPVAPGPPLATATRLVGTVNAFAIDPAGGVYLGVIDDEHRVLKVEASGTINTIAGTGIRGYSGDKGPATKAQLWFPQGLALDGAGNLYIADTSNHRVRKIDSAGTITTIAGNGTQDSTGDGGPATLAQLQFPVDVAIDRSGTLYVAESDGRRVRKIDPNGRISTVAGTGVEGFSGDGGPATQAQLSFPIALAVDDSGNLYIVDRHRIRKVDTAGTITSIAGNGTSGFAGDGGPAATAELDGPDGIAVDRAGTVYIADTSNDRIRKVDANGRISTIAGIGIGSDGNLYIAEGGNDRIRRVDPAGIITTVAGNGAAGFSGDGGPAREAQLNNVWAVAVDATGNLYIADGDNHRIRKVDPSGRITTIAGIGVAGSSGDGGAATGAKLNGPVGVSVDATGEVYIAEEDGNRIRKIDAGGVITTVTGPTTDG